MKFVIAVLIAAVLFGTTGTAQALGTDGSNPIAVGAARMVFGGGLLAFVSWRLLRRSGESFGQLDRSTIVIALIGGVAVIAYQPMFFGGTQLNGVAVGTVVALGSAPVFTGLFEAVMHRRFPGSAWLIATLGALVGVTLLAISSGESAGAGALGLLASAGAGLAYATYTVIAKTMIGRGVSSSTTVGMLFGIAAIGSVPILMLSGPSWMLTSNGITMVAWLAVITTLVANLLFGFGLVGLKASTVSTLTLAEPLTAGLLGIILLHERLTPTGTVGMAVLAASIVWLALRSSRTASS